MANNKGIELPTILEAKTFINENGDERGYFTIKAELCGQTFSLQPKEEEKALFKYLATQAIKENREKEVE